MILSPRSNIEELRRRFGPQLAAARDVPLGQEQILAPHSIHVGGQITAMRSFNRTVFVVVSDSSGSVQARLRFQGDDPPFIIPPNAYFSVCGIAFITKTGDLAIDAQAFEFRENAPT